MCRDVVGGALPVAPYVCEAGDVVLPQRAPETEQAKIDGIVDKRAAQAAEQNISIYHLGQRYGLYAVPIRATAQ